jgi:hypothetical protein
VAWTHHPLPPPSWKIRKRAAPLLSSASSSAKARPLQRPKKQEKKKVKKGDSLHRGADWLVGKDKRTHGLEVFPQQHFCFSFPQSLMTSQRRVAEERAASHNHLRRSESKSFLRGLRRLPVCSELWDFGRNACSGILVDLDACQPVRRLRSLPLPSVRQARTWLAHQLAKMRAEFVFRIPL